MNNLLLVPLNEAVPEEFLKSLHQCDWSVWVTTDSLRAKQILQKGNVQGVIIEFSRDGQSPERMRVLRYVHESCPGALVVMLHSGADSFSSAAASLGRALNVMDETRSVAKPQKLNMYHLSPAQKRIAELVAQAYPNREIARRLKIKEQSVRNELSRIFKKMGVWNRVELALMMRTGHTDPKQQATPAEASFNAAWSAEIKPLAEDAGGTRRLTA